MREWLRPHRWARTRRGQYAIGLTAIVAVVVVFVVLPLASSPTWSLATSGSTGLTNGQQIQQFACSTSSWCAAVTQGSGGSDGRLVSMQLDGDAATVRVLLRLPSKTVPGALTCGSGKQCVYVTASSRGIAIDVVRASHLSQELLPVRVRSSQRIVDVACLSVDRCAVDLAQQVGADLEVTHVSFLLFAPAHLNERTDVVRDVPWSSTVLVDCLGPRSCALATPDADGNHVVRLNWGGGALAAQVTVTLRHPVEVKGAACVSWTRCYFVAERVTPSFVVRPLVLVLRGRRLSSGALLRSTTASHAEFDAIACPPGGTCTLVGLISTNEIVDRAAVWTLHTTSHSVSLTADWSLGATAPASFTNLWCGGSAHCVAVGTESVPVDADGVITGYRQTWLVAHH